MNIELQYISDSFNFYNLDSGSFDSRVGLDKEQAKQFARKRYGISEFKFEKALKEMRSQKPSVVNVENVVYRVWKIKL